MSAYPQAESQTDVVFQVFWNCFATEVVGTDPNTSQSYSGSVNGATPVTYTSGSPFTPYNQLTQEQVLSWVWSDISKEDIEVQVQTQIDNLINPPVVSPPLPW